MEGGGESRLHKAAPPARSATTAAAGPRLLLMHRRYPWSFLSLRTGPADSIRVRSSPRAGCNGLAPNDRGGQRGYPAPPIGGGEGRQQPQDTPPGRPSPAPDQAPPRSGPAPRSRCGERGDGGGARQPSPPANSFGVYSNIPLISERTDYSRNQRIQPLRLEKPYKVIESHRNKAFFPQKRQSILLH